MGSAAHDRAVAEALDSLSERGPAIDRRLRQFSESAEVLSSDRFGLLGRYQNKWVGVYQGKIAAAADTLEQLTQELAAKKIPASDAAIRFIDKDPKTLIL